MSVFSNICKVSQNFFCRWISIRTFDMSSTTKPPYLSEEDVRRCLQDQWSTLVSQIEKGFVSFTEKHLLQPLRSAIAIEKYEGKLNAMSAYDTKSEILGVKLLTVFNENQSKGVPVVQAIVVLFDATNGSIKALIEGQVITDMRTAATSMVATKYLATKDPKIVAMLGSGHQGFSHYRAIKHLYNVEKFRVWDVNEENGQKLVDEMIKDGFQSEFCSSVADAVNEADIVNVATLAKEPVLEKKWVKEGVHINAIGGVGRDGRELDDDLMTSAVVYVDSIESTQAESGDIILSKAKIYAEIGEVANGTKEAFPSKTTIFKSVGLAFEDVVAANLAYERYDEDQIDNGVKELHIKK